MNFEKIQAAATRLEGHVRKTPLLSSPILDEIAGRRILVKAECLQHTGSFKFRGGWAAISALSDAQKASGVIAYSSGNHAQGVANAAKAHGVEAVIVMPADAPEVKIANTRALGAEVVLYDRAGKVSREAIGDKLRFARGLTLVHPYDDPEVIAGQGTTGLEIARQAEVLGIETAEVLVCAGGGGHASGIALALEATAPKMKVRTCEPLGFDDIKNSLAIGAITPHDGQSKSRCDAILTPQPGQLTFPILSRLCNPGLAVSDLDALRAMALAFAHLRIVLEPGGAVALAAALFHSKDIESDTIISVATGGNVDPIVFTEALIKFG